MESKSNKHPNRHNKSGLRLSKTICAICGKKFTQKELKRHKYDEHSN